MTKVKLVLVFVLLCCHLFGAKYSVTQSSIAAVNQQTLSPDDNLIISGILTTPLVLHDGGTVGHPVTITFQPGAAFSRGSWFQNGVNGDAAIYLNSKGNVVIDGAGVGVIECTSNGTGLKTSDDCLGIYGLGNCSNVTVKNLTIRTIYVRTNGTDTQKGNNLKFDNWTGSNILVDGCTLSDSASLVSCAYGTGASAFEVRNCTGTNAGIGCVVVGDRQDYATISGVLIHDNNFSMTMAWSGTRAIHKNLIYCYANNAADHSTMTGTKVYNNKFSGYMGGNATSYVFIDGWNYSPQIYSNVFAPSARDFSGNGFITIKGTANAVISGNTWVGQGDGIAIGTTSGGMLGTGIKFTNNSTVNIFTPIYDQVKMWKTTGASIDKNAYVLASTWYAGTGADTFAQWQAETGMDKNSTNGAVTPPVTPPVIPPVVIPPASAKITGSVSTISADGMSITTVITFDKPVH